MKKSILIFGALCASVVTFGQMKVQSSGTVKISSDLVNEADAFLYIRGDHNAYNTNPKYGVYSRINQIRPNGSPYGNCTAVYGYVDAESTNSFPVRYIGVMGQTTTNASTSQNRYSIGIAGVAGAGNGNVGVYGGINSLPASLPLASYAGYFAGNVAITNQLTVAGVPITSDARYKQNVADLRQTEINKLLLLNPVEYKFKQRYNEYTDTEGNQTQVGVFDENSELFQKKHYGLIAQDVQELYPDLVYEDGDGYLSVDYIGIIPLLISSVKELKAEIDELKRGESAPISAQNAPARPQEETTGEALPALFQNTPNPFNENTEIAFYLPQSVTNAMLCVYDMNGRQLSQNVITQRGSSVFVVNGNQYGAGMYLYSLIADNQIVDTKRMILTK